MCKSLIIPDIHQRIDLVERIISKEKNVDEWIYLGDYFDNKEESIKDVERTALWLKSSLCRRNTFHILGNHDLHYRWPKCPWHITAGHSPEKQAVIDSIITHADWQRTLFAVERGRWWLSHAGLHPNIFVHPVFGWDASRTWGMFHYAEFAAHAGSRHPITENNGESDLFNPFKLRWWNFIPIPGVNQIVGHTAKKEPCFLTTDSSENIMLDTRLQHYAILENNSVTVFEA